VRQRVGQGRRAMLARRRHGGRIIRQTMARSRDLRTGLQPLGATFETLHKNFSALVAVEVAEQEPATDLPYVTLANLSVAPRTVCLSLEFGIVDQNAAEHGPPASGYGARSDNVGRRAKLRR
jgi:hypothetical protein